MKRDIENIEDKKRQIQKNKLEIFNYELSKS